MHRAAQVMKLLFLATALAAGSVAAQQAPLSFVLSDLEIEVAEGNAGTTPVTFHWELVGSAQREVRFIVETPAEPETLQPGTSSLADAGVDYVAIAPTAVVVPPGQASGSTTVHVEGDLDLEATQSFTLVFRSFAGATAPGGRVEARVKILDDDVPIAAPGLMVRPDRFMLAPSLFAHRLTVLANDTQPGGPLSSAAITVLEAPLHGDVDVRSTRIDYQPAPGFVGLDSLRYRACNGEGACGEATVEIEVLLLPPMTGNGERNDRLLVRDLSLPVDLPSPYFTATAFARPRIERLQAGTDPTPGEPFDGDAGTAWTATALPPLAGASSREHRIEVRMTPDRPDGDLWIGIDDNGDGRPSPGEARCAATGASPACTMRVVQERDGLAWWVLSHNRRQDTVRATVKSWQVTLDDGDGSVVAHGPGHVAAGDPFSLVVGWDDARLARNEVHLAYLRTYADDGQWLGDVPVRVNMGASHRTLLRPGETVVLPKAVGESMSYISFDIPEGATRFTVTLGAEGEPFFYLVRPRPDDPPPGGWTHLGTADGLYPGNEWTPRQAPVDGKVSVTLEGADVQPGRWFAVPYFNHATDVEISLRLDVEAVAPVVRPGSYFDPERPGSGLFLYPAGDQWTGLWYTYEDWAPTWYYLQAPAPGEDGFWSSAIYRASWDGDSRRLLRVGTAHLTPTGDDAFQLTYMIDGIAGSRPHTRLGRGCPSSGGLPVDVSSQWFDPARAGTGYSVQMWPDYEYFAAFIYDRQGRPMFLAAENDRFGGPDAVLSLERLTGVCPTCGPVTEGSTTRTPVGTLRRRIEAGRLATIELDAVWGDEAAQAWSALDSVQLLGGPGTTQGCAP